MYKYESQFYRYINQSALRSAAVLVPLVRETLAPAVQGEPAAEVLDVGCGVGAWLSVWKSHGAMVCGLDGDYVDADQLLIGQDEFQGVDLASGFDLGRRFDLVQCLEVAEHLPPAAAPLLVAALCRHGDVVLFSAAPPGQGGENHINEQSYAYWRDLFGAQGYVMYDPLRERVKSNDQVAPWYRFNTFLYVAKQADAALHNTLAPYRLDPTLAPPDVSPPLYRLRKALIRWLPVSLRTRLAHGKRWLVNTRVRHAARQDEPA